MNLGKGHLLVVQHNIWPPNVIGRNVELFDTAVLFGVPNQFVVKPKLFNPKICRHDLVFQVLQKNERAYFGDFVLSSVQSVNNPVGNLFEIYSKIIFESLEKIIEGHFHINVRPSCFFEYNFFFKTFYMSVCDQRNGPRLSITRFRDPDVTRSKNSVL